MNSSSVSISNDNENTFQFLTKAMKNKMISQFNKRLFRPNGVVELLEPKDTKTYSVVELHDAVEGFFEFIRLAYSEYLLVVNQNGIKEKLPINKTASHLLFSCNAFDRDIFGNCLVVHQSLIE